MGHSVNEKIYFNNGDIVLLKADGIYFQPPGSSTSIVWDPDTIFNAYGNIMSLCYGDNFINQTVIPEGNTFGGLFNSSGIISAENLILPALEFNPNPYQISSGVYASMFDGCELLTSVPALPATALAEYCYSYMFNGCTSLTTAPVLPVTTLAEGCYYEMFRGCTSLTTAPELPATTLATQCYNGMFQGCTSLNYIKCLATDISADDCTNEWVYGVASTGTFVKDASMSDWKTGINGIPTNWTVQDAS